MTNPTAQGESEVPELCETCSCPKDWCERHRRCRECHEYHAHHSPKNNLPFCLREKKPTAPLQAQ